MFFCFFFTQITLENCMGLPAVSEACGPVGLCNYILHIHRYTYIKVLLWV